ncbi:hypothetical protein [Escherichia coli]|uniref:hypothetical protein n=1 Tax=Escherichia coli TaxID=562 RepID=UPI002575F0D5|nr:hypothetical protein [Escherichia coli]
MKVIHIVHNYYGFSGASLQAKNLAKALKKHAPNIEQIFVTRCQNRISKLSEDVQFSVMEISSSYKRFWQFFLLCKSLNRMLFISMGLILVFLVFVLFSKYLSIGNQLYWIVMISIH